MPDSTTFFSDGYFATMAATCSGGGFILKDCVLEEFEI